MTSTSTSLEQKPRQPTFVAAHLRPTDASTPFSEIWCLNILSTSSPPAALPEVPRQTFISMMWSFIPCSQLQVAEELLAFVALDELGDLDRVHAAVHLLVQDDHRSDVARANARGLLEREGEVLGRVLVTLERKGF